jgi:hypothetical protein
MLSGNDAMILVSLIIHWELELEFKIMNSYGFERAIIVVEAA